MNWLRQKPKGVAHSSGVLNTEIIETIAGMRLKYRAAIQ